MADKTLRQRVEALSKTYKSLSNTEFVRTGSVVLDAVLGGGIPRGVFILWSAENGCGKSTGSLHVARIYCHQGKKVLYLDYEGGVNDSQLEGIGLKPYLNDPVNNPDGPFYLFQVQTFKDAETILDEIMEDMDLVVIDSGTAMLTEKVKGASSEDVLPGVDSRVMATFLKKYKAEAVRHGTSWIIINQMRTKISFMGATGDVEAGGNALKFYCDIRLLMKRSKQGVLEREEETATGKQKVPFGALCTIAAKKNRYARPDIPLQIAIIFGKGISNNYAFLDYLQNKGDIVKSGAWYTVKFGPFNEKIQGSNALIEWIEKNRDYIKDYIAKDGGYRLIMTPQAITASQEMPDEDVLNGFENVVDSMDSEGEDS